MLHYILQVVFFQLVFLLIYEFLLKKETFFGYNRWYLLATPVIALILPLLKFETLGNMVPAETLVMLPEVIIGATPPPEISQTTSTFSRFQINWWLVIYFIGFLLSLFLFLKKYSSLKKMFGFKIISEEKEFKIIEVPDSNVAYTFFNTIFLGEQLKDNEKQQILSHEMVHVQQKHSLDLLFFELLKLIFWFNPLIYIFQHKIAALHEFIADARVVNSTEKKTYYEQLLNTAFNTENISFINQFFNHSLIKKRIVMLQKSKSRSVARLKYVVLVPLLLVMMTYVSYSAYPQVKEDNNSLSNVKKSKEQGVLEETVEEQNSPLPFAIVEEVPIFPGCENLNSREAKKECTTENINRYVQENFNMGKMKPYAEKGINRIHVQFKITASGDVEVLGVRGKAPEIKEEAKRVVMSLPQMKPGKYNGKKVGVLYALPITFKVAK